MIVYSRSLIQRLTSWAEAVPQAIYGEAAARITELERENADLRQQNAALRSTVREYSDQFISLAREMTDLSERTP